MKNSALCTPKSFKQVCSEHTCTDPQGIILHQSQWLLRSGLTELISVDVDSGLSPSCYEMEPVLTVRGPNCIQRWDSRHYPLPLHSERGGGQRGAERSRCSRSAVKKNETDAMSSLQSRLNRAGLWSECPAHLKQHQPFGYGPMTQEHLWRTSVRFIHLCTILWPSSAYFKGSLQILWGPEAAVQRVKYTLQHHAPAEVDYHLKVTSNRKAC